MKLIIDIPDYDYRYIKEVYEKSDIVESTYSYVYYGTPFDSVIEDIKAEIELFSDKKHTDQLWKEDIFEIIDKHISEKKKGE